MYYTKRQQEIYATLKQIVTTKAHWTDTDPLDVLQAEITETAAREAEYWDTLTNFCDSDAHTAYCQLVKTDWEYAQLRLTLLEDLLIEFTA